MILKKYTNRFEVKAIAFALIFAVSIQSAGARAEQTQRGGASVIADAYRDPGLRLEGIGYRLALANSKLCGRPDMLTGLMLHNIGGYAKDNRATFTEIYNLTYGFGVLEVVPGSVADAAGITAGDEIIGVNDSNLFSFAADSIRERASYDRTEKFVGFLDQKMRSGPVRLEVRRGSVRIAIQLVGAEGCSGRFALLQRRALNAWSDGRTVAVTSRMLEFVTDNDELSFVVAHEMSHNILRHAEKLKGTINWLAEFGLGARKVKATEIEADKLAIEMMANAGYDLSAPERLLRRTSHARGTDLGITHPRTSRRIEIVNAAKAMVAGFQARGELETRPTISFASP